MVASVLFAGCNIAWRYGSGPAIGIVGFRVALGALVAVAIARGQHAGSWRDPLRLRSGRVAVFVQVLGLVSAGTMFRTLDGPLAGLALACTPAVALLLRERAGKLSTLAALGSSLAAVIGLTIAAATDGVDPVTWVSGVVAVAFVAIEVWSLRTSEIAVNDGVNPTALVSSTMITGTLLLLPIGLLFGTLQNPWTLWGALAAAGAVAIFGTVGRVLRTAALPAAGVTAVAASSQINALFTAIGGVLLLGDSATVPSLICTVFAAALGATAVVAAAKWRLGRDPNLGRALDF
ncbi:MAG: hypothetical protein WEA11_04870 [Acidimicrobiales bacterium]